MYKCHVFLPEFAILQNYLLINLGQKFVNIHLKKFIPQFKQIINLFKSFGLLIAK